MACRPFLMLTAVCGTPMSGWGTGQGPWVLFSPAVTCTLETDKGVAAGPGSPRYLAVLYVESQPSRMRRKAETGMSQRR